MKKKVIIGIIIVAVILIVLYSRQAGKAPAVDTYTVGRKDLVQTVSATGELKADSEINLNFEVTGRVREVRAMVGKDVAAGETIAVVDDNTLNQEVANAKALLDRAMAQAGLNDDEADRLKNRRDEAKESLDDTKSLENQRVDAAQQAKKDAENHHNNAVAFYNAVVDEAGENSSTARSAKLTVSTALANLNAAKQAEETAEKAKDLSIAAAESAFETAEDAWERAKSKNQRVFDDSNVASAEAQYQTALSNLEKASLEAPLGGKITQVNFKRGEVLGTSVATPFARMISKDLIVEANVSESDIAKVKLGNKATITFDALGDEEEFRMEVISIDPASTVIQDVVYYVVKFKMEGDVDPRIKPGMTVNIDIETNTKNDVIAIPERLVKEEGSRRYVEVLENEQTKQVDVKLGMRGDEGLIEIQSGLKEGDQIVE